MRRATAAINVILEKNPSDATLVFDRALCYQHLGDLLDASADFRSAGHLGNDPRALMFAAVDMRRLRNIQRWRALLKEAIAVDRGFLPAARALASAK